MKMNKGQQMFLKGCMMLIGVPLIYFSGMGSYRVFSGLPTASPWMIFLLGLIGLVFVVVTISIGE
jgi:hypothetical protein